MREQIILICKRCRRYIGNYVQDKDGTQRVINGQPMGAKIRSVSFISRGSTIKGAPIPCDGKHGCGYTNYIKDTKEMLAAEKAEQFHNGEVCPIHPILGQKCNRSYPCEANKETGYKGCIVWQQHEGVA